MFYKQTHLILHNMAMYNQAEPTKALEAIHLSECAFVMKHSESSSWNQCSIAPGKL